jgi:hypothetical protein
LVALAVGVLLKREELFGERQGLAPAAAGAGPALQARAGESAGESQHKIPAGSRVAPPPPFQGAAGGYAAAFGGTATAASPSPGAGSPAARTAAARQGRPGEPAPPWEASAARGPWSSSTPDWMRSGQGDRQASAASGAGGRAPSARQDTTQAGTPGGRAGGGRWGVPNADADAPAVKPGAGTGTGQVAPSWFDRLGGQAGAPPTVAAPTVASPPVSGATGSGDAASGDTGAGDEADDWPTRYSWLDDETAEGGEAAETVAASTAADAADAAGGDPAKAAAADETDGDIIAFPSPAEPGQASDPDGHDGLDARDGLEAHDGLAGESGADDAGEASHAAAGSEAGSEPPATGEGDAAPGSDLVTVVPGVPRYHRTDCVLIRFMPEGDVQKHSVAAARDAGCTPCAACQPEG